MSNRRASIPVRVGIVGTGWVSTARHIPAFGRDRRAKAVAILGRDPSQADSVAKRFGIPSSFDSLGEFLKEPLDVVSVCTPPGTHASIVAAAIEAGKHVLVEKPMTLTSEEGRSLEALAREADLILCPAHNFLFSRAGRRAKSLLSNGEAGEVQWAMGVQLSSWRRRLPSWFSDLPGGLFFDEAPHLLYLMRHSLGELRIEQAWHTNDATGLSPRMERMEARLQGTQGMGYLTMWFGAPFSEWLLILFCSRAVLVLDLFRDVLIHLPPEQGHSAVDVLKTSVRGTVQLWSGIGASGVQSARRRFLFGHDCLVERFLDAVIEGKESPVSASDGWEVVSLIEGILHRASRAT